MQDANQVIIINCDKDAAAALQLELDAQPNTKSQVTERKNLDGSAATWIVFASLAIQALPHLLNFIIEVVKVHKVQSIKFGEFEITNPSPADVEDLKKIYFRSIEGDK